MGTSDVQWYIITTLIHIIAYGYPAYFTFKAIRTVEKDDDTQWLMYWVIISIFTLFESAADVVLDWLPFYLFVKILFLIWLQAPATCGARIIYTKLLEPQLIAHEAQIDAALNNGALTFARLAGTAVNKVLSSAVGTLSSSGNPTAQLAAGMISAGTSASSSSSSSK